MAYKYFGTCVCKKIKITLQIPKKLDQYSPRQCDCDFCTLRNIIYLSDPIGALVIESSDLIYSQKQGSNQAEFLTCRSCDTVVAASIETEAGRIGALNSCLLENTKLLNKPVIVSPQNLQADKKLTRWKSVWLPLSILA